MSAEVERLRSLMNAQPAELSEAQVDALAAAGNRAVADALHERLCHCDRWPGACVAGYEVTTWDTGAYDTAVPAIVGLWESMRADSVPAELKSLRAEVPELRALVEAMCTAATGHAGPEPQEPRPIAYAAKNTDLLLADAAERSRAAEWPWDMWCRICHIRPTSHRTEAEALEAADRHVKLCHAPQAEVHRLMTAGGLAEFEHLRSRVAELEADLAAKAQDAEAAVKGWGRARERVAALESERHTTNEALSDAAVRMRADRDRIAELEAGIAWRDAERDRWADVHALVERAIDKGWSSIDTVDLEVELGPEPTAPSEAPIAYALTGKAHAEMGGAS